MSRTSRWAAIDIGTNSALLLIVERHSHALRSVVDRATITRLGEGVDQTRKLGPAAIQRTLDCLREYANVLSAHGVDRLSVVATSALRDAQNAEVFLDRASGILGVVPRVISGTEEADLAFFGALSGLPLEGSIVVADIGGGSTEVISGTTGQGQRNLRFGVSLDIGSVRLTERWLRDEPLGESALQSAASDARSLLKGVTRPQLPFVLVGIAGTVTTLACVSMGAQKYESERVHGSQLSLLEVERLCDELAHMSLDERRRVPGLEPRRADVIVGGALVLRELMSYLGAVDVTVSDRGVRWALVERASSSD